MNELSVFFQITILPAGPPKSLSILDFSQVNKDDLKKIFEGEIPGGHANIRQFLSL